MKAWLMVNSIILFMFVSCPRDYKSVLPAVMVTLAYSDIHARLSVLWL